MAGLAGLAQLLARLTTGRLLRQAGADAGTLEAQKFPLVVVGAVVEDSNRLLGAPAGDTGNERSLDLLPLAES